MSRYVIETKNLTKQYGTQKSVASLIESPGFYPNLTAAENLRIFATLRGVPNRNAIKIRLKWLVCPTRTRSCFLNGRTNQWP